MVLCSPIWTTIAKERLSAIGKRTTPPELRGECWNDRTPGLSGSINSNTQRIGLAPASRSVGLQMLRLETLMETTSEIFWWEIGTGTGSFMSQPGTTSLGWLGPTTHAGLGRTRALP